MNKRITAITTAAASAVTYFSLALPTFAQTNVNPCPTQAGFSGLCTLDSSKIGTVLSNVITIILIGAAIIALFFLIYGGIRWITSGGDKAKVETARNTIIAAIIGLIVALLAFFIITIVLGLFGLSLTNLTLPKITGGN
jgi:uncharacterized protein YacL